MTQAQAQITAIKTFAKSLMQDATLEHQFRAAFPDLAEQVLESDQELSEDMLTDVSGGLYYPYGIPREGKK